MTVVLWWPAAAVAPVAVGGWLGVRRFAALMLALCAGMSAAPLLGQVIAACAAAAGFRPGLVTLLLLESCALAAGTALSYRFLARRLNPVQRGRRPSAGERAAGASLGLLHAGLFAWLVLTPPSPGEEPSLLSAPLRELRALRVLGDLSPTEAAALARRPDVKALVEDEGIMALTEEPEIFAKFLRASDGSVAALASLLWEPRVRNTLDDPRLLQKIRRIDLPSLADEVLRIRETAARSLSDAGATSPVPATHPAVPAGKVPEGSGVAGATR